MGLTDSGSLADGEISRLTFILTRPSPSKASFPFIDSLDPIIAVDSDGPGSDAESTAALTIRLIS